jgi:hypothetical protein
MGSVEAVRVQGLPEHRGRAGELGRKRVVREV